MKYPEPSITVGRHTYGFDKAKIMWPLANVQVGAFCSFAPLCKLVLGGNHRADWITTFPFGLVSQDAFGKSVPDGHPSTSGDIVIGNDVWIGFNVTIMSGVTIGDGAVIAANSHVVKDVEPYSITGGNPAKHIRYRFSQEIIEILLKLKWWEKSDREIRELLPVLMAEPDVETLKALLQ